MNLKCAKKGLAKIHSREITQKTILYLYYIDKMWRTYALYLSGRAAPPVFKHIRIITYMF